MTPVANELFSRFTPAERRASSNALHIAVVGGGPSGLLLAWKLLDTGHNVTLFEKRDEYQLNRAPDSRSYNLTADGLGLRAFGRLSNLIYSAGVIVVGRAIHSPSGLWTHPYGYRASDHLVSIPRGDLLALLTGTISDHPCCTLHFSSEVQDADVKKGLVRWKHKTRTETLDNLDLIAFADGVHGLGLQKAKNQPGVDSVSETEDTPYLNLTIPREAVAQAKLELNRIHFFPSDESLGIGLPNYDGTISLLIEARITKNHKDEPVCPFTRRTPFDFSQTVFTKRDAFECYLQNQNRKLPRLLEDCPNTQILNRPAGHFIESFVNNWRVGKVGVLVGDAGSCAPPWAGFGMNLACSHAADLAHLINDSDSVVGALVRYNVRRQKCTTVVREIIRQHGVLLNSGIGSRKWRREQALRERREQVLGERSAYQMVAFEEGGLEDLAGLQ